MLRRLVVNTGSNMMALFINMAITLIMSPIYIKTLGHYDYGLREMVMALTGYMGLLSLGMQPTIVRFASMHNAEKNRDALFVVYASALVFMFLVGLLLATFFWVWAVSFPQSIMPENGGAETKYTLFLLIIGANLFFVFPKYVVDSYLEGMQRYYIKNNINILGTILIATTAYIYITPENGLLLLVGLVAISATVKLFIFSALLLRPAYGAIYPNLRYFSWPKLKELLRFGLKSFVQGASSRIETVSDRLVIGSILGPALVPVYSVPSNLVNYLANISRQLTSAFMPFYSDLNARGQYNRVKKIYLLASKLIVGFIVPAGVGFVVIGGPFIDVWMSGEFSRSQVDSIILMLVLYTAIPKLNPFASTYLTAIGRHGIFAKVAPFAALANLALSIWFVHLFGVIGAAMGSVLPVFVIMPIYLTHSCRALKLPVREYVTKSMLPTLMPTVVMGLVTFWMRYQWGLDSYLEIIGCAAIGGLIYAALFWFVSFKASEREFLINLVKTKFA